MTQVTILPLPPVPSVQTFTGQGGMLTQPAQQWLVELREKVNQINAVVIAISGAGTPIGAFNALSPLTTNGDLLTYSSGTNVRLPIGTDGQVLTVVSGMPAWAAGGGGSSPLTTKGDIYTYSTVNARLPVGINGQILTADSTQTTGLSWTTPGTTNYDTVVLSDSPVGYWKLSDISGTSAADSSTNNNSGTYAGGYIFLGSAGPSNLNGGVILDGTSGIITVNSIAAYNLTSWSAEGWIILSSAPGNINSYILVERWTGGSNPINYSIGVNIDATAAGMAQTGYYTGSAWVTAKGPVLQVGILYQIVGTYDGTTLKLYVNGAMVSSITSSSHVTSNDGLIIGAGNQASTSFFPGTISSISLYNTALSASRVKAHYLAGR